MADPDSPLTRPVSVADLIRGLLALAAVITVGAAFAAGRATLGLVVIGFVALATGLGYGASRRRRAP